MQDKTKKRLRWIAAGLVIAAVSGGWAFVIIPVAYFGYSLFKREIYPKTSAGASIQNLLQGLQRAGLPFQGEIDKAAYRYIEDAWEAAPKAFDSRNGKLPRELPTVVYALAVAAERLDKYDHPNALTVTYALSEAISASLAHKPIPDFTATEHDMIRYGMQVFRDIDGRYKDNPAMQRIAAMVTNF